MKVFLVQDVKGLGRKGDIKEVNDGYARNFLLPKKIAVIMTDARTKIISEEKKVQKQTLNKTKLELEVKAKTLDGQTFIFNSKADKNGHLYGSIGPKELSQKIGVDEKIIHNHFKELGDYSLVLNFNDGLSATVKVVVKNEK